MRKIDFIGNSLSNVTVDPLPYVDDLLSCYQSLTDLPGFILLESTDQIRGRYDIVSAYPYDHFKVERDAADLSEVFHQLQHRLPLVTSSSDLPFQGGAIGYIAYDLGAQLAGINVPAHPGLASMPIIDMQFYDWAIVTDHHKKQVHLVAANNQPQTRGLLHDIRRRWYQHASTNRSFTLVKPFSPLLSRQAYQQAFHAIHHDLQRGRAYQVNYTQPFLAEYRGDCWEMYKRISRKNPVPFSAFMRAEQADILSFSPERFLQMDNKHLLTSPIKGSARRSENPQEDERLRAELAASTKNRAENVMIVDLLRNDLGKIAVAGSVQVKTLCELQSFKAVHHLVSDIEAQCLDSVSLLQAFASCFPGGSITGAPKLEAMHIISEHEPFARGVYCGSIGYFSLHGRFDSNIAIRTVIAKENTLFLAAGGGIVIDSTWEEEYAECYTKIQAIVHEL